MKRYLGSGQLLAGRSGSAGIPASAAICRMHRSASTAASRFRSRSGSVTNAGKTSARSPASPMTVIGIPEAIDGNKEHGRQVSPGLKVDPRTFSREEGFYCLKPEEMKEGIFCDRTGTSSGNLDIRIQDGISGLPKSSGPPSAGESFRNLYMHICRMSILVRV